MPEKPVDTRAMAPYQRNAELIINRLNDYLSIRFDHASRITPNLKLVKQDLIYHELVNVRRCLLGDKIYGPVRHHVADVFLGDDEKRRRGLMSATDQTSIQVELVSHCQDERVESTRGQIRIHDLKTFYAAINPSLSDFLDLVETWIWWDILDSAELVRFEQKLGLINMIRQGRLTDEMRKRYATLIQPVEGDAAAVSIPDEEVIRYELRQLTTIRDQWNTRRQSERGFMYTLKRDELPQPNRGDLIHQIAARVREYDAVDAMAEIDEETRHRYALDLRLPPDKVTRENVLDFLQNQLLGAERVMIGQADHEAELGAPYNYKERQLEQMDRWLSDLGQQLRGIIKTAAPAVAPAGAQ